MPARREPVSAAQTFALTLSPWAQPTERALHEYFPFALAATASQSRTVHHSISQSGEWLNPPTHKLTRSLLIPLVTHNLRHAAMGSPVSAGFGARLPQSHKSSPSASKALWWSSSSPSLGPRVSRPRLLAAACETPALGLSEWSGAVVVTSSMTASSSDAASSGRSETSRLGETRSKDCQTATVNENMTRRRHLQDVPRLRNPRA